MLLNLSIHTSKSNVYDRIYDANGFLIKGQIKELNIPFPCRVRLYERISGRLIKEVLTDNLGNYKFDFLAKSTYFIVAHHPSNQYNAVIADLVVPK